MPRPQPLDLIESAIALVNAAADGADDEEITPDRIAAAIRMALATSTEGAVSHHLEEALDAVSDGMPADYVAGHLYAAAKMAR